MADEEFDWDEAQGMLLASDRSDEEVLAALIDMGSREDTAREMIQDRETFRHRFRDTA